MINRIHGGNIWLYPENKRLVDFSANINPLGIPKSLKINIIRNIDRLINYPEPESTGVKKLLAAYHNIKEDNLIAGNGSIELIYLIPRALNIKNALVITPAFSEYEFALKANKSGIVFHKTKEKDNFKIDIQAVEKLLKNMDAVFLGNPNNPTGNFLEKDELFELVKYCEINNKLMVVDEAFIGFLFNGEEFSLIEKVNRTKNLIVIRSLTKLYAIPGLRIGYAAGHKDLIKMLRGIQYPWNVNLFAQAAVKDILEADKYIKDTRKNISTEKDFLFNNLRKAEGVKVFCPSVNFILCKLRNRKIKNADELKDKLISKGILIRSCGNFRGLNNEYFRVAIRKRRENIKLIKALKDVLGEKS
ncbi:MAG: threonine-phosphate decarboxylase CobD [bacterium]